MEAKLDTLIEKIKHEGVEEAQRMSDDIVNGAKQEAETLVERAGKEAEGIVEEARAQAAKLQENAELTLRQAARDMELLVKERITSLFDRAFKQEVADVLEPEFLRDLILKVVEQWSPDGSAEIAIDEADCERLEALLFSGLRKGLRKSVTLKVSDRVSRGFRIELEGEDIYYDFTDEAVSDVLRTFLTPRIRAILDRENG